MVQLNMSFAMLLTLILIVLKVLDVLDMSWLIVLSPMWVPFFVSILWVICSGIWDYLFGEIR